MATAQAGVLDLPASEDAELVGASLQSVLSNVCTPAPSSLHGQRGRHFERNWRLNQNPVNLLTHVRGLNFGDYNDPPVLYEVFIYSRGEGNLRGGSDFSDGGLAKNEVFFET